jgi:hypothetical protein
MTHELGASALTPNRSATPRRDRAETVPKPDKGAAHPFDHEPRSAR